MPDVTVMGAGIVGCSVALELARAGAEVEVRDPAGVAAGASGRNSGAIQDPFEPVLTELFEASLATYRELGVVAGAPVGVMVLAASPGDLPRGVPGELVESAAAVEPCLAPDLAALVVDTGWVVSPAAATQAVAAAAAAAGARFPVDPNGTPSMTDPQVTEVICAGWQSGAVAGVALPVTAVWGVTADCDVRPGHILEAHGIDHIVTAAPEHLFSNVGGVLGSTFLTQEPDPQAWVQRLVAEGRRYLPGLRGATGARTCARPASADGRPFLGQVGEQRWVAAGHGPWGISTGPASGRLIADAILGRGAIPPALDVAR